MKALIDMDIVVYRAGFASEKKLWTAHQEYKQVNNDNTPPSLFKIYFDQGVNKQKAMKQLQDDGYSLEGWEWKEEYRVDPIEYALGTAKRIINNILDEVGTTEYKGYLSTSHDDTLFRLALAKTQKYKDNRKDFKKPHHYEDIRGYLMTRFDTEMVKGIEADDALGIDQTDDTIICSIDKDLLQIPGHHYNFVKKEFTFIDELMGWFNFYKQVLVGDRADNIPGLYRVGEVRATTWLARCKDKEEMYKMCLNAYKEFSGRDDYEDFMHEVCNLIYILREPGVLYAPHC